MKNKTQPSSMQPKVVDLDRGRVLFVSDIHDRHEAFDHLVAIFRDRVENGEEIFLVVGGDSEKRETFDCLWELKQTYNERVVLLTGNYECAIIMGFWSVGRCRERDEVDLIFAKMADELGEDVEVYIQFFRSMSFAARTRNGIVLTHAGGSPKVKSMSDIERFDWSRCVDRYTGDGYDRFLNTPLGDFLWNLDLRNRSARRFLKAMSDERVKAIVSVSGHAHLPDLRSRWTREGVGKIGKQILISNFFNDKAPGVYSYVEIDTERCYRNVDDFLVGREIKHFVL